MEMPVGGGVQELSSDRPKYGVWGGAGAGVGAVEAEAGAGAVEAGAGGEIEMGIPGCGRCTCDWGRRWRRARDLPKRRQNPGVGGAFYK